MKVRYVFISDLSLHESLVYVPQVCISPTSLTYDRLRHELTSFTILILQYDDMNSSFETLYSVKLRHHIEQITGGEEFPL